MTRQLRFRLEKLERLLGSGDEWAGHPDADLLRPHPWLAWLTDDELARAVADEGVMDEVQSLGAARHAEAHRPR